MRRWPSIWILTSILCTPMLTDADLSKKDGETVLDRSRIVSFEGATVYVPVKMAWGDSALDIAVTGKTYRRTRSHLDRSIPYERIHEIEHYKGGEPNADAGMSVSISFGLMGKKAEDWLQIVYADSTDAEQNLLVRLDEEEVDTYRTLIPEKVPGFTVLPVKTPALAAQNDEPVGTVDRKARKVVFDSGREIDFEDFRRIVNLRIAGFTLEEANEVKARLARAIADRRSGKEARLHWSDFYDGTWADGDCWWIQEGDGACVGCASKDRTWEYCMDESGGRQMEFFRNEPFFTQP